MAHWLATTVSGLTFVISVFLVAPCRCGPLRAAQRGGLSSEGLRSTLPHHRHNRAANSIHIQLENFIHYIKVTRAQEMRRSKEIEINQSQIKHHKWRPTRDYYRSLRRNNASSYPKFYLKLQYFNSVFDDLINMSINSSDSTLDIDHMKRTQTKTKEHIKLLMTETEHVIANTNKKILPYTKADMKVPTNTNITTGLVYNDVILKDLDDFLKKSRNRMFSKRKKGLKKKPKKVSRSSKHTPANAKQQKTAPKKNGQSKS